MNIQIEKQAKYIKVINNRRNIRDNKCEKRD